MPSNIHVGTSGWHYEHWLGPFYPPELKAQEMLRFYCQRLGTVEINNSFYHLPSPETFRLWKRESPPDFVFAVKASRYITHMKKLKEPGPSLEKFLLHARELGNKLGPILFQLPPRWGRQAPRLRAFLQALPRDCRCAFEFRDPSWFHPEIYSLLEQHRAAFCVYDLAGRQSPEILTSGFGYLRLHGPSPCEYAGRYTRAQLRAWLRLAVSWLEQNAQEIFVYFDNDQAGYAALNALELQEMAQAEL
jgi:uncharacterized protein YecE (DUF72 family)